MAESSRLTIEPPSGAVSVRELIRGKKDSAMEQLYGPKYTKFLQDKIDKGDFYGFQAETIGPVADELGAGVNALFDWGYGQFASDNPPSLGDLYNERLKMYREAQDKYRSEHPVASIGANVLGGAAVTPAAGASGAALGLGRAALQGAKAGAVGGGIMGAAEGRGTTGRAESGAIGAGIGAGLGTAIPLVGTAISRIANGLKNIAGLKGEGALTRARQMLAEAMDRDGISLADLQAKANSGKPITAADLGPNTRELISAAGRRSGPGMKQLESFLEDRTKGQFGRMETDLARESGQDPMALRATRDAAAAQRSAAAETGYPAAYANKAPTLSENAQAILETPAGRGAVREAMTFMQNNRSPVYDASGNYTVEMLDQIQRAMRDRASRAAGARSGERAANVGSLRNEFLNELPDDLKKVMADYRTQSEIIDAMDNGRKFIRQDAEDIAADFAKMSPDEKNMFRLGAARELRAKMGQVVDTGDASRLFQNENMRDRLREIFPDIESYKRFMQATVDERTMQQTANQMIGNSKTAARQVADEEFQQGTLGLGDAAIDALRGKGLVGTTLDWALKVGAGAKDRVAHGLNARVGGELVDLGTRADLGDVATRLAATSPRGGLPVAATAPTPAAGPAAAGAQVGQAMAPEAPKSRSMTIEPPAENTGASLKTTRPGVDLADVTEGTKRKVIALQRRFGKGLAISSGYRSPEYNAKVGGARKSRHMKGDAVDIPTGDMSMAERLRLINTASELGFTGIGIYGDSIHLDTGKRRAWGPSYHSDSIPKWAGTIINRHLNRSD